MTPETIVAHDRRVPRYTSYPTAADFTAAVDAATYRRWLAALPADAALSLYVHVPFCASLCWFCGCHTSVVRRYDPVADYLALVARETAIVAAATGPHRRVRHIHWGGGSPSMLRPDDVRRLTEALRTAFAVADDAAFAVEIDPRTVSRETVAALAAAGVNRASVGVQDFAPAVQRAINRVQTFERTRAVVDALREAGIGALNVDLLYGLPHQTPAGIAATVERTLALGPDRIALYGYAHVPWMKRHQRLIDERALPDARGRARLFARAAREITARGYRAIGLDHFARPGDPLAAAADAGRLRRNFQGYTVDPAPALIGIGASAIGTLPQGYVQNAPRTPDYRRAIDAGEPAIARGVAVDADDRLRRDVIERLMCDLEVDLAAVAAAHGASADAFARDLDSLSSLAACGAVSIDGTRVRVASDARLLLRVVCAAFDRRLAPAAERHAPAV